MLSLLLAQVWMPDEPETSSKPARSQSLRWDDTPSSASAVLPQDDSESASASGRHSTTESKGTQQKGPPSWWDPPPRIHVDQRYKEQVCYLLWVLRNHLQQRVRLLSSRQLQSPYASLRRYNCNTASRLCGQWQTWPMLWLPCCDLANAVAPLLAVFAVGCHVLDCCNTSKLGKLSTFCPLQALAAAAGAYDV